MIALEHLADGSISDRNFQKLRELTLDTGGVSAGIRFGTASGAWPGGSSRASNTTQDHGLGRTPAVVLAVLTSSPSATWFPVIATFSYTATQFSFSAVTSDGSSPAAATGYSIAWVAIG